MPTYILRNVPAGLVKRAKDGAKRLGRFSVDQHLLEVLSRFAAHSPDPCPHAFGERYDINTDAHVCAGCGAVCAGQVFEITAANTVNPER